MSAGRQDAGFTLLGSLFVGILLLIANQLTGPARTSPTTRSASTTSVSVDSLPSPSPAGTYRVIGVSDGDTITVLKGGKPLKIRFAEIDTPEKGQPFGNNAKQALAGRIAGKDVRVDIQETDRYGRAIAHVHDREGHVNSWMIENGWAWHYKAYSSDATLALAEDRARQAKRGLWADKRPIEPWNWRKLSAVERDRYR